MPPCTPDVFWQQFLAYVSPAAAALLSATALWVASRARSTSQAAQVTSQAAVAISTEDLHSPAINELLQAVRDQRKP